MRSPHAPLHARILRSARGAFDLPSIITGVVIVGILAAGVLAAVFAVIPWAQDNGAKQDLSAIRTAEGVAKTKDGRFMNSAMLDAAGYVSTPLAAAESGSGGFTRVADVAPGKPLVVETDAAGTCYVSVVLSPTGNLFAATSTRSDPFAITSPADLTECLSPAAMVELFANLPDHDTSASAAPGVPANMKVTASTSAGADFAWDAVAGATGYLVQYRINGGTWTTASDNQPGTTIHVAGSAGNTIEVRAAALTGSATSAFSTTAFVNLATPTTGPLAAWGYNGNGEYGNGYVNYTNTDAGQAPVAAAIGLAGRNITSISAGPASCAVVDGEAYCWGDNSQGATGTGSTDDQPTPTRVAGLLSGKTVTQISSAGETVCAVANGSVFCWGNNDRGQLGNGSTIDSNVPVAAVGALSGKTVSSVSAGNQNVCAVAEGAAYCWGMGDLGGVGNGSVTPTNYTSPVAVDVTGPLNGKSIESVTVGDSHACALSDGTAYCWGYDFYGQVGNGTQGGQWPTAVGGVLAGKQVTSLAAGNYHTCAVADGAAYCWGANLKGQLGDGTTTDSSIPVAVDISGVLASKNVTAVTASSATSGVIADGKAVTWGSNPYGDLGTGGTVDSHVPVNVDATGLLAGKTVIHLSIGGTNVLAMHY